MAMKTTFLAVVFLVISVSKPTSAVDCTSGGNEACGPTERCESNTCVDRGTCDVSSDCSDHGTCETDKSCKCAPGYTGNDCSKVTCGTKKCTSPEVCAGPSGSEDCVADPCTGTPCGANGDCRYDDKLADPKPVCTCTNGYGGDNCADAPECESAADCTDEAKPECKKEAGKKSVCAEKSGGNIVAAAPGIILAVILSAFYL